MNYSHWLIFHSYYRWLVLLAMLFQLLWIYWQHKHKRIFKASDWQLLLGFTLVYNIQLILGWLLYCSSPISMGFWQDLPANLKNRQLRFFGLEHMSMMTLGILLFNVLTIISRKKIGSPAFSYLWKRIIWIYLIILCSVPWSFSPLTSRPNFR